MNWLNYIPPDDDVQVSRSTDFQACGSYSFIHILQIVLKYKTGLFFDFSERAMAKLSDTQPWGNSLQNIVDAAKQDGALLAEDWPELTHSSNYENINWATYYATIPQSVLKRAFKVKVTPLKKLQPSEVAAALEKAPLWTIVKMGNLNHIVAQINDKQFYDSYEVKIKNFSDGYPILSQYQLLIEVKNMSNSYLIQVNKKDGTKEIAVALPAVDGRSLIDKTLNVGLPIPTLNNGSDVDWPNLPIKYVVNE